MDKKGEQSKEGSDMKLTVCCKSFSILETGRSLLENISYAALNVNRPGATQITSGTKRQSQVLLLGQANNTLLNQNELFSRARVRPRPSNRNTALKIAQHSCSVHNEHLPIFYCR